MSPEGQQVNTFGTMTCDLLALAEGLQSVDVNHVAMESTGVFWQPIYNVMEDAGLDVLVANARRIKAVPGRKTDVKDAEWTVRSDSPQPVELIRSTLLVQRNRAGPGCEPVEMRSAII